MAKSHLKLVTPATEKRTVTPTRRPNADLRTREYLTEAEVERLLKATKGNRWAHRDGTMILGGVPARPAGERGCGPALGSGGLRNGHPARPQGQAGQPEHPSDPWGRVALPCGGCSANRSQSLPSCSRRSAAHPSPPRALPAWSSARVPRLNFGFKVHPHMLRHACGFALASKGHDTRALQAYLGHKNIQHTVRYTELSPTRFRNFWRG